MELRQLGYFLAVAHERSFTRAAERLHVAQPGISPQIRQLEAELGSRLFDRSAKPIRLTPAGRALLPHAEGALDAAAAGRDAVAHLRSVVSGHAPPDAQHIIAIRPAITQRYTVLVWNEDRHHSTAVEAFLAHARAWVAHGDG